MGNVMQKKLLLSLVVVGSGNICVNNLNADNVKQAIKNVSEDDLKKEMGELAEKVKDVSKDDLSKQKEKIAKKMSALQRLIWEKEISEYKESNKQEMEKALIDDISKQDNAIQTKFRANVNSNRTKAEEDKKKESDHSIGWLWSTEATKESKFGKVNQGISDVKAKKDQINEKHAKLITDNKNDVSSKLTDQLMHQRYILANIYLKELQMCSEQCKGNKDCFKECLFQKDNKGNWQDIENENFFKRFANDAYNATACYAHSKGIFISASDIEKSVKNKKELADVIKSMGDLEAEANAIRNRIFNPQSESQSKIDLTGDESEEKHSILGEDPRDDQNDQGALSQ